VAKAPLHQSKRVVYLLAALFSLDSFGGGFVVQSMVALWLYQRFGLSLATTGTIFFATGVLTAFSYLVAVRIANRVGLIRSALSQMDVPTRSSYVMAIVTPEERPAAASITNVPRSLASAASPLLAGYLLGLSTFGWPLLIAGATKIVYDLLLLAMFGKVRPPEESKPGSRTSKGTVRPDPGK